MLILTPQQTASVFDCLRADRIVGWDERPLTAIDELLWRTLLFTFQNKKDGACWPSIQTLADVTGCCRRTACTGIQRLKKAGWLKWRHRRRRLKGGKWTQAPNLYELVIPRRWRRTVSECKPCHRTTGIFIHIAQGHLMRQKKVVAAPVKLAPVVPPPGFGSNSDILTNIDDPRLKETVRRCLLIAAQGQEKGESQ